MTSPAASKWAFRLGLVPIGLMGVATMFVPGVPLLAGWGGVAAVFALALVVSVAAETGIAAALRRLPMAMVAAALVCGVCAGFFALASIAGHAYGISP